jgi:quercetin dioxygenase-like cupin family protein
MTVMLLELPPRAVVPLHGHPHEWLGTALEGGFELIIGGGRGNTKTGDMSIIPGGVPDQAIGSEGTALFFDVWSPPRGKPLH